MAMALVTKDNFLIGVCSENAKGWRFIPAMASHQTSRKSHATAEASVPRWAKRFDVELVDYKEWEKNR